MRFQCNTSELAIALRTVTKALAGKTTNQILEGVLIEAGSDVSGDDMLTLTCTDERISIVTHIHATVDEAGRGVVPGKMFGEIVRRLSEVKTDISMNGNYVFNIRSGRTHMNISGQNGELFPALPTVNAVCEVKLPQDMLRDMIQKTAFAISQDDAREVLTGCLLEIEKGNVNMVGLDGYRLALCHAKCSDMPDKITAIIPGRAVSEISSILTDSDEVFVQLSFSGNKLRIKMLNNPADAVDSTEIYVVLIDGEFVGYRQLLPESFATRIEVAVEPFRQSVDRAALVARESINKTIVLSVENGKLLIEAHSQTSDVYEELPIIQEGSNLTIGFNSLYLADMARLMNSGTMEMCFNSAVQPCVVRPVGNSDYTHLILPVRLAAQ